VQQTFRVVKQFKESWLHTTLQSALPGSEARLLADQGVACTVKLSKVSDPVSGLSVAVVLLFLLQFIVPKHFNLTASILYATKNLTLRRY
jgi:hypothetical protein